MEGGGEKEYVGCGCLEELPRREKELRKVGEGL